MTIISILPEKTKMLDYIFYPHMITVEFFKSKNFVGVGKEKKIPDSILGIVEISFQNLYFILLI